MGEDDPALIGRGDALRIPAVDQFGAYSGNANASGPLRRYAREMLPKSQSFLEYSKRLHGGV